MNLEEIKQQKAELFEMVKRHFNDESIAEAWFSTNNLNFGNTTPDILILMGRGNKVKEFILNALNENDRKQM